jgi:hypothetical protein
MPEITLKEVVRLKNNILPVTSKTGNMLWTDVRYTTSNVYTSSNNTKRILFFAKLLERRIQKFLVDYTWVFIKEYELDLYKSSILTTVSRVETGLGLVDYRMNLKRVDTYDIGAGPVVETSYILKDIIIATPSFITLVETIKNNLKIIK